MDFNEIEIDISEQELVEAVNAEGYDQIQEVGVMLGLNCHQLLQQAAAFLVASGELEAFIDSLSNVEPDEDVEDEDA